MYNKRVLILNHSVSLFLELCYLSWFILFRPITKSNYPIKFLSRRKLKEVVGII